MSSEAPVDFQSLYPWITTEFFERILQREYGDNSIRVRSYTLKAALAKGENYLSQMLRTTVRFTANSSTTVAAAADQSISLIIKTVLPNAEINTVTAELGLFRKEIVAFQRVIPAVEKLLQSIGDETKLSARCYDSNLEQSYLIFEDLAVSGYKNTNRRQGLDANHYRAVFTKLAKWHAATAVLLNQVSFKLTRKQTQLLYD